LISQGVKGKKKPVFQLPCVLRLKFAGFEFNYHVAAEVQVIKQQVDIKIVAADIQMILIAEKRKPGPKLQQKLRHIFHERLFDFPFQHIRLERDKIENVRILHRLDGELALRRRQAQFKIGYLFG